MTSGDSQHPCVVPLNDPLRPWKARWNEAQGVIESVIQSGVAFDGVHSDTLRNRLKGLWQKEHVVLCGNGTDALRLAMASVGVSAGDSVAAVANAGGYATVAAKQLGARMCFADVARDSLLMDPECLASLSSTRKLSAVVFTHLYGNISRISEIKAICEERGIPLIEDCAQALGASVAGASAGSFGDVATTSFYPTKNVGGIGDGGALAMHSARSSQTAAMLGQYGWGTRYRVDILGGANTRLDEIQAALINLSMNDLFGGIQRRGAIAQQYEAVLQEHDGLRGLASDASSHHLYPILVEQRESFVDFMTERGIQTGIHYPVPDHRQPAWQVEFKEEELAVTEWASGRVVSLPIFADMTQSEVEATCMGVRDYARSLAPGRIG